MTESGGTEVAYDPFAKDAISRVVDSTPAQREIWVADQLSREASLAFNESISLTLDGVVDVGAMFSAVSYLAERHEALRATFSDDGLQMFIAESASLQMGVEDLTGHDEPGQAQRLREASRQQVVEPFDLSVGPLLRATLFLLSRNHSVLMLTSHHVVCDGWSFGVMAKELMQAYASYASGGSPALPEAQAFGDYAAALNEAGWKSAADESLKYWIGQYDSEVPVLDLPVDHPRPAVRGFGSRREDLLIDAQLIARLRKVSAGSGASLFATLLGAFGAMMSRLSGATSVVVGVPAAGQSAHEKERLVGHCVNLLPVLLDTEGVQASSEMLARAQRAVLDAYDHQACSFGEILSRLKVDRDPSRLPLVSVQFNLDSRIRPEDLAVPGVRASLASIAREFENFELFVNASQSEEGITLECQYSTELFSIETVRSWLELYREGLDRLAANVQAPLRDLFQPTAAQLSQISEWNRTGQDHDRSTNVARLFEQAAKAAPSRIALVCDSHELSYGELDARSNQIARVLRARGCGRGSLVGLCLRRDQDLVVAQMAVLKSGAGYVPLDPAYPPDRLAYMVKDADLTALVTTSDLAATVTWPRDKSVWFDGDRAELERQAKGPLAPDEARDAIPASAAYVIYTSGSTGKPKGVQVPHGAVVNFLRGVARRPGIEASDGLLAVTTLSFDIAVLELLLPLTTGAKVYLATRDQTLDGALLRRLLEESAATIMQATPATWRLLLEAGWRGRPDFKALVGGEALPRDLARALLDRVGELWNMYGPTETTVWSTCARVVDAEHRITIGTPLPNQHVYVLDEQRNPCPIGVSGELWIGGEGVTTGYVNLPAQTSERFLPDPFMREPSARMYRTGDRGRWTFDGQLEHQGRLDAQVKVRGFRIELGEIETQIAQHPDVSQCVVIVREDNVADLRIVAYVVWSTQGRDADMLRGHLQRVLPEYMIPQHFVNLEAIPRLPNGKLDRKSLPRPAVATTANANRLAPRNPLESRLLASMEAVLHLPGIGIRDSFFSLGGHSLLAARLTAQINRELDINLPLRTLFEAPTVEQLALRVEAAKSANDSATRIRIVKGPDQSKAPLTVMQERIRFMEALHPGRVVYNTPSAHRLTGELDLPAFRSAFWQILQRQPSLRTCIVPVTQGAYEQLILERLEFELPLVDLTHLPPPAREDELMRRMQALIDTPLDIGRCPLFVAVLYRMSDTQHVFLFMPHHIIWDGWSFDILYEEISELYLAARQGRSARLPALEITYADYARWHAMWVGSDDCRSQVAFWKRRYAAARPLRGIPTDRQRKAGMSGVGAVAWVGVDKLLTERLRELSVRLGVTLNMVTMAVHAMLVSHSTGEHGVVLGMPVRGRVISEVEPIMGFFNNLLPLNLEVDAAKEFSSWLGVIREQTVSAFANQDVPFELLAGEAEFAVAAQGGQLYQSLFSFQDARHRTHDWGGLKHQSVLVMQKGATEDFGLWLMDVPHGLEGGINYNADIFDASTAELFRERYLGLLKRVAENPEARISELLDAPGPDLERFSAWLLRARLAGQRPAAPEPRVPSGSGVQPDPRVAAIWARLLGLDEDAIRAEDNFFDLGGNSMLAMQVVAAMDSELGVKLDPKRLLVEPLGAIAGPARGVRVGTGGANETQQVQLKEIWAELLGLDVAQIRPEDNFFDLGGNSLLAMRAISESSSRHGLQIEPQRYITDTLAQLAATATRAIAPADAPREQQSASRKGGFSRLFRVFGRD
jgi:amino acid adenylation domain-containing protein